MDGKPAQAKYRKTLAWALFANGLHHEAEAQMKQALDLENSSLRKRRLREDLTRLRAMSEQARTPTPSPDDGR